MAEVEKEQGLKQLRFAIRGRSAKFAGFSLGQRLLTLEIMFHIFNPNEFPVAIQGAKYRIYFREGGDVKIGEGSVKESIYIPAHDAEHAKSEVKTPLTGDLAKMIIHQMEKARTTLDFEGIAHITTPEGPVDMTFKAVWKLG